VDRPDRAAIVDELKQGLATLRENGLFDLFAFRSAELAETLGVDLQVVIESALAPDCAVLARPEQAHLGGQLWAGWMGGLRSSPVAPVVWVGRMR